MVVHTNRKENHKSFLHAKTSKEEFLRWVKRNQIMLFVLTMKITIQFMRHALDIVDKLLGKKQHSSYTKTYDVIL